MDINPSLSVSYSYYTCTHNFFCQVCEVQEHAEVGDIHQQGHAEEEGRGEQTAAEHQAHVQEGVRASGVAHHFQKQKENIKVIDYWQNIG